jgi:malate synthase
MRDVGEVSMDSSVEIAGPVAPRQREILTDPAFEFLAGLHRRFNSARADLLAQRVLRQADLDRGVRPGFRDDTAHLRAGDWRVAPAPADLEDRRVEITGPVERKMMINALNSGASVFMADFEDALSPTWENVLEGQVNLVDAVRRRLEYRSPEGKEYKLGKKTATLLVRPRGWHLPEKHLRVDGEPISASLFDFGLYFFHNARELVERGTGPYFYLPKLESYLEAELWNNVFLHAQDALGIPRGTIRATVLIETLLAAFEMEEILWVLREHAAGLNAGRWDYIFSIIRKLRSWDLVLPDRAQITMAVPFMRAYTDLLVATCHRRGAHAIGGMAAFIPSRKDPEVTRVALEKVREDKQREVDAGFDGTWVAHPDLVPVARKSFDHVLGERPHQKDRQRPLEPGEPGEATAERLLDFRVPGGKVTAAGLRTNVEVALQYLDSWLQGQGATAIHNLMEDAATAEISRAQLWQWIQRAAPLADGGTATAELYRQVRAEELAQLGGPERGRLGAAAEILDQLVLAPEFPSFLTLLAYDRLE